MNSSTIDMPNVCVSPGAVDNRMRLSSAEGSASASNGKLSSRSNCCRRERAMVISQKSARSSCQRLSRCFAAGPSKCRNTVSNDMPRARRTETNEAAMSTSCAMTSAASSVTSECVGTMSCSAPTRHSSLVWTSIRRGMISASMVRDIASRRADSE